MHFLATALIAFVIGTSVPQGYQCKTPDFDRIKSATEFTQQHIDSFTANYKKYGSVKIINLYLPENEDTAIAVLEVKSLGLRQATIVVVLTWTDQWMITGFTVRDEGLFRYLKPFMQ